MIILQCDRCGYKVEIMPDCGNTIPFRYGDYKFYYTELPRKKELFLCEECNKELPRIILECDDAVKDTWDKKMNEWLNQAGKENGAYENND